MFYRVTIQKFEKNPNYDKELAEYEESQRRDVWSRRDAGVTSPFPEITTGVLSTVLNEEQFHAMQKAVLEKF